MIIYILEIWHKHMFIHSRFVESESKGIEEGIKYFNKYPNMYDYSANFVINKINTCHKDISDTIIIKDYLPIDYIKKELLNNSDKYSTCLNYSLQECITYDRFGKLICSQMDLIHNIDSNHFDSIYCTNYLRTPGYISDIKIGDIVSYKNPSCSDKYKGMYVVMNNFATGISYGDLISGMSELEGIYKNKYSYVPLTECPNENWVKKLNFIPEKYSFLWYNQQCVLTGLIPFNNIEIELLENKKMNIGVENIEFINNTISFRDSNSYKQNITIIE